MDDVDGLLIAEPCNVGIIHAHKGSLNYKVIAKGVAAHSSMPELGNNAIEQLNDAMMQITADIRPRLVPSPIRYLAIPCIISRSSKATRR